MAYWLVKSEPEEFSIDDLRARPGRKEHWDGVRNFQARNYLRDMRKGDEVLFYHSNCEVPGVAGIASVAREAYPDHTAFDPDDAHYDVKSDPQNPRWLMVDVKYVRKLKRTIPLAELKNNPKLEGMALVRKANRLSVMPVTAAQWRAVLAME